MFTSRIPVSTANVTFPSINASTAINDESLTSDDAAWALSCAFLILTMQTGFAMLECGNVSAKNATSIMVKNCIDVTLGGLSYWCFGYGLTFGTDYPNPFCGLGHWFFSMNEDDPAWGTSYSHYFFHFSFASTATTIVSGAVAERMNLYAYMVFAFYNTVVYCIPASWAWNSGHGWLDQMGFFDFAGVCIVHYGGGVSALVAAYMVGPRLGRFETPDAYKMSSPVTALTGMFMLWWAWMSFNAGSTFGVQGNLWKVSALASVVTLNGGIAGGLFGIAISMMLYRGKVLINETVNSVLGGLVAVTGICPLTSPTEALVIGAIGGAIAVFGQYLIIRIKIDDPVGAIPVHMLSAAWGTLAVGLCAKDITGHFDGRRGLFHGGGFHMLYVQVVGLLAVTAWAGLTTLGALKILDMTVGLRTSMEEEILGADWCHHHVHSEGWNQEVLGDVIGKLKDGRVNEHVAEQVLNQLTKQLVQFSKTRKDSAVPTKYSAGLQNGLITQSPERPVSRMGRIDESIAETSIMKRRRQSFKDQLNEVVNDAATLIPEAHGYSTQYAGPMMVPLYKSFRMRPPTTRSDRTHTSDELDSGEGSSSAIARAKRE